MKDGEFPLHDFWRPNSFEKLKLTDAFTLIVGQPLDKVGLAKAVAESGRTVVAHDPGNPQREDLRLNPNRVNVTLDASGVIQKIDFG